MPQHILLTGATGYVGGRLLERLEKEGHHVTCLVRRPEEFKQRTTRANIVGGDVFSKDSLKTAFSGIDQAIYLIHSLGGTGSYAEKDHQAALNFATEAANAGVKRILYLGGLGNSDKELSTHLRSRQDVGEVLRAGSVPVTEFRASIIIGSGSLSFEMIRSLVERLPIMITPRWVSTQAQPISIKDVLDYLMLGLVQPLGPSKIYEIGGDDIVSYGDMMREYARLRGLHRLLIPVPVITPRLSSLWLGLVTPLYARVGRKLVDSLRCSTIVCDTSAREDFPIAPLGVVDAIDQALKEEEQDFRESYWADAFSSATEIKKWGGVRFGSRLVDMRTREVDVPPEKAFVPIQCIGGKNGWYCANGLWRVRGWIDLLFGGVGLRRGRRNPHALRVGDVLDWWRVEAYEPGHLLRLRAEMKLPGRAWLEFEVTPTATGSQIKQTAVFDPLGLCGLAYWYGIYPIHQIIFIGMLRQIAKLARS